MRAPDQSNFNFLKRPLTGQEIYELTDQWSEAGNAALFSGYSVLFLTHHSDKSFLNAMDLAFYSCAWNYLFFLARIATHIYKFREIARNPNARKKLLALELFDLTGTLVLGTGTTLSLLATLNVFQGILAVAFLPLATLAPAFTASMKGIIELFHAYRSYKRTHLTYLLTDTMKQYARFREKCDASSPEQTESLVALREKILALARVVYATNQMSAKELDELLRAYNLRGDPSLDLAFIFLPPTNEQRSLVEGLLDSHADQYREHMLNAAFWLAVGIGAALVSVGTFFFAPLLIVGIAVIALAVVVKAAHLLEADRRIANVFRKKENRVAIKNDNPIMNSLARRHKAKEVISVYLESDRLTNVPSKSNNKPLSNEDRVRLRLAYELSVKHTKNKSIDEAGFYDAVLKLPRAKRQKVLSRAMERHIERRALSDCSFSKALERGEKQRYVDAYCRKGYQLFGHSKRTEQCSDDSEKIECPSRGTYVAVTNVQALS